MMMLMILMIKMIIVVMMMKMLIIIIITALKLWRDTSTHLYGGARHLSVNGDHRPHQSVRGCAVRARAVGHVERTVVTRLQLKKGEIFYLTTHSTHFIYGYMATDII